MLKNYATRFLVPAARNAIQKRSQSVVSGPPTQHVPKSELYIMGTTFVVTVLAYPIYILFHIRSYRK